MIEGVLHFNPDQTDRQSIKAEGQIKLSIKVLGSEILGVSTTHNIKGIFGVKQKKIIEL